MPDPKGHWTRDIFLMAHQNFKKNRVSLEDFFRSKGMNHDWTVFEFEFNQAMNILVPSNINAQQPNIVDMDKGQRDRLIRELRDHTTGKISIEKFKKIYNTIRLNELLQEIVTQVRTKFFSIEYFFSKYNYNSCLKTVPFSRFEDALRDLKIDFSSYDMDILRAEMDPRYTNAMNISAILDFKGDAQECTPNLAFLSSTEKAELDAILDDIKAFTHEKKINLLNEFTKADYAGQNRLLKDEFLLVLSILGIPLSQSEVKIVSSAFGNPLTRKINYRKFCDAVNDARGLNKVPEVVQDIYKKTIDPDKLKERLRELYAAIRQKYVTLESFFTSNDKDGRKSINRDEFVNILMHLRINIAAEEIGPLYNMIDPECRNIDYFRFLWPLRIILMPTLEASLSESLVLCPIGEKN